MLPSARQDADYWLAPDAFLPDRFLSGQASDEAEGTPGGAVSGEDLEIALGTPVGRQDRSLAWQDEDAGDGVIAAAAKRAGTVTRRRKAGKQPTDPFAFIPFGAGPRICLGAQLAMAECVMAVALILWRYDLDPVQVAEEFPASAHGLANDRRLLVRVARRRDESVKSL